MTHTQLLRRVARATGESLSVVRRLGFSLVSLPRCRRTCKKQREHHTRSESASKPASITGNSAVKE